MFTASSSCHLLKSCIFFNVLVRAEMKMKSNRQFTSFIPSNPNVCPSIRFSTSIYNIYNAPVARFCQGDNCRLLSSKLWGEYLVPWGRFLLDMLLVPQLIKKFPNFYGAQRSVSVYTRACHLSQSSTGLIQATPSCPVIYFRVYQVASFLQVFPTKTSARFSSTCATFYSRLILLRLITWIIFGEEYRRWSSSSCSSFHCPGTFFTLDDNVFLSIFFSNALNPPLVSLRPSVTPVYNDSKVIVSIFKQSQPLYEIAVRPKKY